MFVFPARRMLDEIRQRLPETARFADALSRAGPAAEARVVEEGFAACESISIDYAVMEQAERVAVVAARFDWSDVGSWDAVADRAGVDVPGTPLVLAERARNAFVRSDAAGRKVVAVVGLDDVIIVDTPDALLVCRRGVSQDVRAIVEELKKRGRGDLV